MLWRLLSDMWLNKLLANTLFIILDRNERLETGQRLLCISELSDSFLRGGHMTAVFIDAGNTPLVREAFTISLITGNNSRRKCSVLRYLIVCSKFEVIHIGFTGMKKFRDR